MGQRRITSEIVRYFELNQNENPTYQNPWDTTKATFRGKAIA